MADVQDELEHALDHIDTALDADGTEMKNEWVLRKARQALLLEIWEYEERRD